MPDHLLAHLKVWRARAEEALADAGSLTDPQARDEMMGIAAGYQRLCQEADLLLQHKKGPGAKSWCPQSDSE
jgi:hypothetical protein